MQQPEYTMSKVKEPNQKGHIMKNHKSETNKNNNSHKENTTMSHEIDKKKLDQAVVDEATAITEGIASEIEETINSSKGATKKKSDGDNDEKKKMSLADRRYLQALEYAEDNFECRATSGGGEMWSSLNTPGVYFPSRNEVMARIQLNAIPGIKTSRDNADNITTIIAAQARDDYDDGYVDAVAPRPRIFPTKEATYIDTFSPGSGTVVVSRFGVEYNVPYDNELQVPQFIRSGMLNRMEVDNTDDDVRGVTKMFTKHLNVPRRDWTTVLAWLILRIVSPLSALPILMVQGEPGSGKTTTATRIKELLDPSSSNVSIMPRESEKLADVLYPRSVCLFDNITGVSQAQSDILAIAATGGAYEKRKLYSDGDIFIQDISRQVIMTCVDTPVLRADLRSRILFIVSESLKDNYRSTQEMYYEWQEDLPHFRAVLFRLASEVMADMHENYYAPTARLADFSVVVQAVDSVFKKHGINVPSASKRMVEAQEELARDSIHPIIEFIIDSLDVEVKGTPSQILSELVSIAKERNHPTNTWGSTGRWMSSRLKENASALEDAGVVVENYQERTKGRNAYRIIPITGESMPKMERVK